MIVRARTSAALLVLLALLGAHAVVAAPPALNGAVQYESFRYTDAETAAPRWENFFAATLRSHGQLSSTLTWDFEGRAVADDANFTAGAYSLRNATSERPYLSLIAAAVDYRPTADLRVSVGKQIANWSTFDEIQPANLITPRDESDIFRRVELGVPAVAVHYGGNSFAELIVVPLAFTPSRLPQGRWNIGSTLAHQIGGTFVERQDLPPVRLNETQAGARAGTHWGALEASVVGYVGRDPEAVFLPGRAIVKFVNGRLKVTPVIIDHFAQLRAGGMTASYPFAERWLLRTESVYYNSPERDRGDFLHSVAGVECALDDVRVKLAGLDFPLDGWRVVVSYFRDDQTVSATEPVTNNGERRFFESFIFGEIRYDPGGRVRGQLRGGYDITGEFSLLQPELSYRLWRSLWLTLSGENIQATRTHYEHNKTSYFDGIRHEDRIGTRLEYQF